MKKQESRRQLISICMILSVVGLVSCVTTHVSEESVLPGHDLSVSCAHHPDVSSRRFILLTCVFENTGDHWTRVQVQSISLEGAKLSTTEETLAFVEAWKTRQQMEQFNTAAVVGGLVIGGLALATSGGKQGSDIGLGLATISGGAGSSMEFEKSYRDAQYGQAVYGVEHLMGGSLLLAPESFLRRSILWEANMDLFELREDMEICFSTPKEECIKVKPNLGLNRQGRF